MDEQATLELKLELLEQVGNIFDKVTTRLLNNNVTTSLLSDKATSLLSDKSRDKVTTSLLSDKSRDKVTTSLLSNNVTTSLLSDKAILRYIKEGKIIIEPFFHENLCTTSYDVSLGPYYFRETDPEPGRGIYNPFSKSDVERIWGEPREAELLCNYTSRTGVTLDNISPDDRIIWVKPQETILAATNEFIGGKHTVTTMMKARSSLGRNFIEVCKCAGWGDVGYVNRWTMEITNNSRYYSIPLVVGRRVAQIVFFDTEGIVGNSYESSGKYQSTVDVEALKKMWRPQDMLPKMYNDREIIRKNV